MIGVLEEIGEIQGVLSDVESLEGDLTIPDIIYIEGSDDYEQLKNKPSIESVTLIGNKDFEDLGLSNISAEDLLEILS